MARIGEHKKGKTVREYGQVFESLMSYAETRLGKKKIKSQQELREVFILLDKHRKDQQEQGKISDKLIDILVNHPKSRGYIGRTIGHGRGEQHISTKYIQRHEEKILAYRAQGASLYAYDKGIVAKIRYINKNNRVIYRFRDIDKGNFVSHKAITGDA